MSEQVKEDRVNAIEISRRSRYGPVLTASVILVMFVLLAGSTVYYATRDQVNMIGGENSGDDHEEIFIELTEEPEILTSNQRLSFQGRTTYESGTDVEGASVSIKIPDVSDEVYRSTTDPDGLFELSLQLPILDESSNFTMELTASKDDIISETVIVEKEYHPPPEWTFMIYMSDCDLESWALKDINEMETIESSPLLNIIVQLDRWESLSPKDDRSDGNWTTAKRFKIEYDDDVDTMGSDELMDLGEIDSSDPEEIVDFATWAADRYPADNYALVLWNHGSGTEGICWEQSGETETVLSIDSLGWALDRITNDIDRNIDILGFDACLMSAFEVAYEVSPFCDLMIGSELTEPGYGWDYKTFGELVSDPYLSPVELSELFMIDYLEQMGKLGSKSSMSMGVYDLSLIEPVGEALNDLGNTIADKGSAELYNMKIARKYAQPIQEGHSSDAVDLYDFIENLVKITDDPSVKEGSATVLEAIERSVLHFNYTQVGGWSTDGLNGLSIYAPDFKDVMDDNDYYSDLKFAEDTSWPSLLDSYYEELEKASANRILVFEEAFLSCSTSDEDGDGCRDTIKHHYSVRSLGEETEAFLGINIYNLRGDNIASLGHNFNISSAEPISFTVSFTLEEHEGGPGLYRISSYLCTGNSFDRGYFQDYTRSGYRWLEVRSD